MTLTRRFALAAIAAASLGSTAAQAQAFPDKPVTFIVPFAAGSATDQLARALGQGVTQETKQPVVVDNKAGANAFIGAQAAARAPKDGYTVFITTNTTHAANEHLFKKLPYDPVKDFEPKDSLPGLAFAYLIRSCTLFTGRLVFTMRICPPLLSSVIGSKSFTGSYGSFLNRCSFAACVVFVVMNTV